MCRKNVLLIVAVAIFALSASAVAAVITVTKEIQVENDDAEEYLNTETFNGGWGGGYAQGVMYLDSGDLEVGDDEGGTGEFWQVVALQYDQLGIPQVATINSATITFTIDEPAYGVGNSNDFTILAEAVDNAAVFTSTAYNITDRARTIAAVAWAPDSAAAAVGSTVVTSDISAVIQEVVNRPGWSNNNRFTLMIYPDVYLALPDPLTGGPGPVQTSVFEAGPGSDSATLTVEYVLDKATVPDPADGATDVYHSVVLSWKLGEYADKHDVYFGTVFDDVSSADRANPLDVLLSQGQSFATYEPDDRLDFGQTYYWRIDEVNAPPDSTIFKGKVWSFTTELFVYPIENVTATASSSNVSEGAEKTADGSGVDVNDLHSTETTEMWRSSPEGDGLPLIEYEFDKVSKLHEMWVWNHNSSLEQIYGFGFKDVLIEYSTDGIDYKTLGTTHEFAQAPGAPDYAHETIIDFAGAAAKYVKLTANSTWGSVLGGLSEVRFFEIPVHAKEPYPNSEATDVNLDVVLGWQAGREAARHDVYIGADPDALTLADSVTEPAFDAASLGLELGQDYYWRVDEVNDAEATTTWQGDVWNFKTIGYLVVDDFEDYDVGNNEIWWSWKDGLGYVEHDGQPAYLGNGTGSAVGDEGTSTYMETTIVHGGDKSMPFWYDNNKPVYSKYSETAFTLPAGRRDWTANGVEQLSLCFRGESTNVVERLYVAVANTAGTPAVIYNDDPNAVQLTNWIQWRIPLQSFADQGVNLTNVDSIAIGVGTRGNETIAGGTGKMYFDDIRLYPVQLNMISITVPDAGFDDHVLSNVGDWIDIADRDYTGAWKSHSGDAWIDYGYYAGDGDLPALSGNNKVYGYDDSIYQILDETFIEGTTYLLNVWVGQAWSDYADGWWLYFTGEDHNNDLIEASGNGPVGSWAQVSLTYTATAADAGKKIGIKMYGNEYVTFEDVALFHSSDE